MSDYWVSFVVREETIDGRTSQARRAALNAALEDLADYSWVETTSFWLIDTQSSIDAIASACKNAIAEDDDIVLIRSLSSTSARVVGGVEAMPMLKAFMDYVRKV